MSSPLELLDSPEAIETRPPASPVFSSTAVEINHYDFDSDFEGPRNSASEESVTNPENNEESLYSEHCIIKIGEEVLSPNCHEHVEPQNFNVTEVAQESTPKKDHTYVDFNENVEGLSPMEVESKSFHHKLSFWKRIDVEGSIDQNPTVVYPAFSFFSSPAGDEPKRDGSSTAIPMIQITPPTEPPPKNPATKNPADKSLKELAISDSHPTSSKPAFLDNLPPPPKKHRNKRDGKVSTTAINYYGDGPKIREKRGSNSGSILSGISGDSFSSNHITHVGSQGTTQPSTKRRKCGLPKCCSCEDCCWCTYQVQSKVKNNCCKCYIKLKESERFNCIIFSIGALLLFFLCAYIISYPIYVALSKK